MKTNQIAKEEERRKLREVDRESVLIKLPNHDLTAETTEEVKNKKAAHKAVLLVAMNNAKKQVLSELTEETNKDEVALKSLKRKKTSSKTAMVKKSR